MSEETKEVQSNGPVMDSAEFESKLTEFFTLHKESKLRLVPKIAAEFKGHEETVLEYLHNKYVLGIVAEKPRKKTVPKESAASAPSEPVPEPQPKSRKKLILIISSIVILAGLGVAGFMLKDKFLGKKEEPANTEQTPPVDAQPSDEQPKKEESAPSAAVTDSVPSSSPDSSAAQPDSSLSK